MTNVPAVAALTVVLAVFVQAATAPAQTPTGPIRPLDPPPPGTTKSMTGDLRDPKNLRHRDSLGRPCLDLSASSRQLPTASNLFEHIVAVRNQCLKTIRVKLCYHKADRCLMVEVGSHQRKETVLGVFPSLRYFQYDYQEQY